MTFSHIFRIILVVLACNFSSRLYAQNFIEFTKQERILLNDFLKNEQLLPATPEIRDSITYYLSFSPLKEFNGAKSRKYGVYIMIPPISPKQEFVCLIDNSVKPLKTMDLEEDVRSILNYIKIYNEHFSKNEIFRILETISIKYKSRQIKKGSYLPR